jgi:hypothetical protein
MAHTKTLARHAIYLAEDLLKIWMLFFWDFVQRLECQKEHSVSET